MLICLHLSFNLCLCYREESAASENAEPVQLFWKADKKSIHQIDDGNSTKSFSFGMLYNMNLIFFIGFLWFESFGVES